ncbi:hypothetical protein HPP92_023289 [Vanilla planifolia]|uniref:Pentatricopeptide repeat-containing protein n=1 Tax=Vanilla planifolia TaxID=51239 RepID=A0A835PTP9_VANPL|nr:hypothetical protein HPP92_023587 [Vanilla planifolia]KAG0460137.1 hypothetical protein HPP92_023265 [Vanilla planifolia]KAG0460161.1 hypothetical protein HPP92_023289 [Vanilla planifolia]
MASQSTSALAMTTLVQLDNVLVTWNSLIDAYMSGKIKMARRLFDAVPECDLFSWSSTINGYSKCGAFDSARELFDMMSETNLLSWNAVIDGYTKKGEVVSVRKLFGPLPDKNVVTWNSMIIGYEKA